MDKIQKFNTAIEKGFSYNSNTGDVFGVKGFVCKTKDKDGYIVFGFRFDNKYYRCIAHQFAYYYIHKKTVRCIDHINENLRSVTISENGFNIKNVKGYYYCSTRKKYTSEIVLNSKRIFLGRFETELEAKTKYLEAKKIYHAYNRQEA